MVLRTAYVATLKINIWAEMRRIAGKIISRTRCCSIKPYQYDTTSSMIIGLWIWAKPIILNLPCHAMPCNCCVWPESRTAFPEEKAITWSPILAPHHITNGLVTTFWNSGKVAGRVYTTDGCGYSWSVLSVLFTLAPGDFKKNIRYYHTTILPY